MSKDKTEKPPPKKRGRKPKGGKIVTTNVSNIVKNEIITNIVLHLKCRKSDIQTVSLISNLNYNPTVEAIESYSINNTKNQNLDLNLLTDIDEQNENEIIEKNEDVDKKYNKDLKMIWKKLKVLENDLHTNNLSLKKSACFWCTYDFDNPAIYIPKCKFKESYKVYGCFCSPECACAHLMKENLESSVRYERYSLLNFIYCKIYNHKKHIKPAPEPHYTLDKFYGNLSIQEYRKLLRNERLLMIIDKPLTRVLPELHEDNENANSSKYVLKRNQDPTEKPNMFK
tara:strand:- start:393 stop:1244 length:852 start_codon:yes stop_codon:yes gene_type:complete